MILLYSMTISLGLHLLRILPCFKALGNVGKKHATIPKFEPPVPQLN